MNGPIPPGHRVAVLPPALAALGDLVGALLRGDAAPNSPALPLDLVRRHLLAPLAFRAGLDVFRKDYVAAALHAERREALLIEALDGLRGTPVLLLKGISYISTIYADPAERPMTDIDLLVPADRFAAAVAALRRAGYRDDGKRNQRSPANHAVTLRRRESAIDLHRHMVQRGRMDLDLAAIWRDAIAARHGALRPAPAHEYLIHLAHMARHELTVPLIAFADALRLGARAGDVRELAARWRLCRALALLEHSLESLQSSTGVSHPSTGVSHPDRDRGPGVSHPDRRPGVSHPDRGHPDRGHPDRGPGVSHPVNWWNERVFPGRGELLAGTLPPRWLQVVRKLAIHDSPRDWVAFAGASVRTRLGV